jgi:formiminotetrahydrofolate cyclodeaminase
MTVEEREEYQDIIDDLKAQRTLLRAALKTALANTEIQTYSLNDSEGGQSATRRDPERISAQLDALDRRIHFYSRLLMDRPATFCPRRW